MVYLKRQGDLRLRFQQPDNSWSEASASLGTMLSTKEMFTHAAFASNNGMHSKFFIRSSSNRIRQ